MNVSLIYFSGYNSGINLVNHLPKSLSSIYVHNDDDRELFELAKCVYEQTLLNIIPTHLYNLYIFKHTCMKFLYKTYRVVDKEDTNAKYKKRQLNYSCCSSVKRVGTSFLVNDVLIKRFEVPYLYRNPLKYAAASPQDFLANFFLPISLIYQEIINLNLVEKA